MRWLCGALLAASCLGCQESVDAVLGTGQAYTVYGYFDARADTQAVRVFAIERSLDMIRPEPLGARVVSVETDTGASQAWSDSVLQYQDQRYGHVFWSVFRPVFSRKYRLELTRYDGVVTSAEVEIPPLAEPELLPPTVAEGYVVLPVFWPQAPRVNNIRVRYFTNRGRFVYDYPLEQDQSSSGVVVAIKMSADARRIFSRVVGGGDRAADVRLKAVELQVLVTNTEWVPPGGVYDPDVLVEPGTFSNVDNGFGFVGAGYEAAFYYEPPDSTLLAAGFYVD